MPSWRFWWARMYWLYALLSNTYFHLCMYGRILFFSFSLAHHLRIHVFSSSPFFSMLTYIHSIHTFIHTYANVFCILPCLEHKDGLCRRWNGPTLRFWESSGHWPMRMRQLLAHVTSCWKQWRKPLPMFPGRLLIFRQWRKKRKGRFFILLYLYIYILIMFMFVACLYFYPPSFSFYEDWNWA